MKGGINENSETRHKGSCLWRLRLGVCHKLLIQLELQSETLLERGGWGKRKKSGGEVRKKEQWGRKIYLVGLNLVDMIYDSE